MKNLSVKDLVLMAFYVALIYGIGHICQYIRNLPNAKRRKLGVSTLALLMASYHLGWKKGLFVSVVSVFAQFVTGPMYTPDLLGFLLDYLLAFSVYGIACLFPNFGYFYTGVLVTNFIRFVCSTISGTVVWGVDLWGSIVYQATYMVPTLILGLIIVPLLYKAVEPSIKK